MSNVLAGLLAGLVTITYSLSYAVFIFSGELAPFLHIGLLSALLSACVIAVIVSLMSSFRFAIAGPDSNAAALLALIAASVTQNIPPDRQATDLLPTLWMAIALSALLTGITLFALGRMRLGRLIRFIPYPVVGGFLAATGWLIFQGSFKVMCGISLTFENLDLLFEMSPLWRCLSGLGFGLILLFVTRRWKHFLVLPVILLVGLGFFYGILNGMNIPLASARANGWLFQSLPETNLNPWQAFSWLHTDWWLLLDQVINMMAMMAVVAITILLNASGLELATMSDADLDQELRAAGVANAISGLFGGMVGYLSISRSLLNHEAGARHRVAGFVAGLLCMILVLWGSSVLLYIPKPLLGGLLCYLGLALLFEWLVDARKKLSHFDFFLVLSILLFVSIWGFLTAVGLGTVIASLLFAFNYSKVRVVKHAMSCKEHRSNVMRSLREQEWLENEGERIGIFCLQGFIFFGTVSNLIFDISARVKTPDLSSLDFLLLDFRLVSGLDSSATLSFLKMKRMASHHHFVLVFTDVDQETKKRLVESGCIKDSDERCRIFSDLDRGLEFCENLLLDELSGDSVDSAHFSAQVHHIFEDPGTLPQLLGYMERYTIPKGQTLFRQGDDADALYFIESGKLTVTLLRPGGELKRLASIGSGTIVGEIGLFLNRTRTASVITEEAVTLYRLERKQLNVMQKDKPSLAMAFQQAVIKMLSKRLIRANKELDILLK